jgi:predicted regulator of Ras-like GTPase activity (Roadblock/LC7/MglB family)
MAGLPNLIEEDVRVMNFALDELLRKTDSIAGMIIDKGGPLICQRGNADQFDTLTMAALAAGAFCATQAMAERMGEPTFNNVYQQGTTHSLLVSNIDDNLLLIVIFRASSSVGLIKYFATGVIKQIANQLERAAQRMPGKTLDLVSLNVLDASAVFHRKAG